MTLLLLFNQSLHQRFLDTADRMLAESPAAAVVFAHTACEILAEQVLGTAFAYRNVPELKGPVTSLLGRNSTLGNERVRKIYEALPRTPSGRRPSGLDSWNPASYGMTSFTEGERCRLRRAKRLARSRGSAPRTLIAVRQSF